MPINARINGKIHFMSDHMSTFSQSFLGRLWLKFQVYFLPQSLNFLSAMDFSNSLTDYSSEDQ